MTVSSSSCCMCPTITNEYSPPYVYNVSVNASSARLSPVQTCHFGFPSRLLLMGAAVITACRPTGVTVLILVPNSSDLGLSNVSALLSSHRGGTQYEEEYL